MSEVNGQTPEEIRAEIERKRNEMGRKVDAIQDRFAPDNLKAEARSLAQDVVSESTETIKEFVRTNSAELGRSVVESFKRNPLPSALIMAGLGWMVFNSTQGDARDERMAGDRAYGDWRGRGYGAPYAGQGYSRRGDPSYDRNYDRGFYTNQRYGSQPRPEYGPQYRGPAAGYVEEGYGRWYDADNDRYGYGNFDARAGESFIDKAGNLVDRAGNILQNAADRAGSAVASAADKVTDTARDAAGAVKQTVGNVENSVSNQASRMAGAGADANTTLRQTAGTVADKLTHTVAETREQVMGQAAEWTDEARRRADEMSQEAQFQMMRAQEAAARTIDENLLTFGALALLAGAAVGLALPATRRERQFMGDYSNRVVERTQQVAGTVAAEVQNVAGNVADDVAPKLQQVVADVTENLKQVGQDVQQAGKDVTQDLTKGVQKAGDTLKEKVEETTGVRMDTTSNKDTATNRQGNGSDKKQS